MTAQKSEAQKKEEREKIEREQAERERLAQVQAQASVSPQIQPQVPPAQDQAVAPKAPFTDASATKASLKALKASKDEPSLTPSGSNSQISLMEQDYNLQAMSGNEYKEGYKKEITAKGEIKFHFPTQELLYKFAEDQAAKLRPAVITEMRKDKSGEMQEMVVAYSDGKSPLLQKVPVDKQVTLEKHRELASELHAVEHPKPG